MIVIADTGPVNYLVLIGEIEVLPALYGRVLVPPLVCEELKRPHAPEAVRTWASRPPPWLGVRAPTKSPDEHLARLDGGERDAILLAEEVGAAQLIIDEVSGRREARRRQLPFTGTLGVLAVGPKEAYWICEAPWIAYAGPHFIFQKMSWTASRDMSPNRRW